MCSNNKINFNSSAVPCPVPNPISIPIPSIQGIPGPQSPPGILGYGSLNGSSPHLVDGTDVIFDETGPVLDTRPVGDSQIQVLTGGVYEIIAHIRLNGQAGAVANFILERNGASISATSFIGAMPNSNDSSVTISVVHQIALNANDLISIGNPFVSGLIEYTDRNLTIKRLS
ncbi:hypothetical protein [Bacillus sp. XF8]|uniref:hypothetical protein n=1 Tax=Bacillus sp. XF8 TaxID=2819289 RepID=UPI001AA02BE9|nr:hypothetical protein [Bacillus sp. XF8]MBO1583166.1 hypothetical protein [Bacillus sp. XF8]